MSEQEFPSELIARCAETLIVSWKNDEPLFAQIERVLRESGHAELVAALKDLHSKWKNHTDDTLRGQAKHGNGMASIIIGARAALRKAGEL